MGAKDNNIHRIEIKAHGSSTGFAGLKSGECDIAMASRRIKEGEAQALSGMGDMTAIANEHILAIDGIAVLVNRSNPLSTLDLERLKQIFSGRITNWAEVGGKNAAIKIHARDNRSGTYDTFKTLVLGKSALANTATRSPSLSTSALPRGSSVSS